MEAVCPRVRLPPSPARAPTLAKGGVVGSHCEHRELHGYLERGGTSLGNSVFDVSLPILMGVHAALACTRGDLVALGPLRTSLGNSVFDVSLPILMGGSRGTRVNSGRFDCLGAPSPSTSIPPFRRGSNCQAEPRPAPQSTQCPLLRVTDVALRLKHSKATRHYAFDAFITDRLPCVCPQTSLDWGARPSVWE